MILISHRGNLYGPNSAMENRPGYIIEAINAGYNVEVDVWNIDGCFYLGHDRPEYPIEESFLESEVLWCHAKNMIAFDNMLKNNKIHCFWHQEDDYALTSRGIIWVFPGKPMVKNSVCVMPEAFKSNFADNKWVCSDYVGNISDGSYRW